MKSPVKSAREGRRPKPFQREYRDLGPRRCGFHFNGVWIRPEQFASAVKDHGRKYRARLERPNDPLILDLATQNEEDRLAADALGTLKIRNYANEVEACMIFKRGPEADRALQGMKSMYLTATDRGLADDREARPRSHTSVQEFLKDKVRDKF